MTTPYDRIKQAVIGNPPIASKQPSRQGVVRAFAEMQAQLEGAQAGAIIKATFADLDALASVPYAGIMAWVTNDPTFNGIYENTGTDIAPAWTYRCPIPQFLITAINAGEGTANAIEAETDLPVPSEDGRAMIIVPILGTNSAATTTVSLNGGTALEIVTNAGNSINPGALIAGMNIAGFVSNAGTKFRLLSDTVSSADRIAAEAAATATQAWRDEAAGFAGFTGLSHAASTGAEVAYTLRSGYPFNKMKAGNSVMGSVQEGGWSTRPNFIGYQIHWEEQIAVAAVNVFTVICPFIVNVETFRNIDVVFRNPITGQYGNAYNNIENTAIITDGAGTTTIEITTFVACAIGDEVQFTIKSNLEVSGSAVLNDQHGYDNAIGQSISNHQRGDHLYILDGPGHTAQLGGAYNYSKGYAGFQGGLRNYIGFIDSGSGYNITFGIGNHADSIASGAIGQYNEVQGQASFAIGSRNRINNFPFVNVTGQRGEAFSAGQRVHSFGKSTDTIFGRNQITETGVSGQTTDATPTNLTNAGNSVFSPMDNTAYRCEIKGIASLANQSKIQTWGRTVIISKLAGVVKINNSTGAVGVTSDGIAIGVPTWALSVDANGGNIEVLATGAAGETVSWSVELRMVQIVPS